MTNWVKVGVVDCDSGRIWIGDAYRYAEPARVLKEAVRECRALYDARAVVVRPAAGDGSYPIYVERNKAGRVVAVKITLDERGD